MTKNHCIPDSHVSAFDKNLSQSNTKNAGDVHVEPLILPGAYGSPIIRNTASSTGWTYASLGHYFSTPSVTL